MTTLVYVHGRSQQGKDPDVLRERWTLALKGGLAAAGAEQIYPVKAVLPYFGNALHALELAAGAEIELEGVSPSRRRSIAPQYPVEVARLETQLLLSMRAEANGGIVPESWIDETLLSIPGAMNVLRFLADRTHTDEELISLMLRDVAVYLTSARSAVLDIVKKSLMLVDDSILIIAHSLGGAVARDLLDDNDIFDRAVGWMTIGSPLGLDAVYNNLSTPGCHNPGLPWAAVRDLQDVVALGHPLRPLYGGPLEDIVVDNPIGNGHSIEQYLKHRDVASWIGKMLA